MNWKRFGDWCDSLTISFVLAGFIVLIVINHSFHFVDCSYSLENLCFAVIIVNLNGVYASDLRRTFNTLQGPLSARNRRRSFTYCFKQASIFLNVMMKSMVCSGVLPNYANMVNKAWCRHDMRTISALGETLARQADFYWMDHTVYTKKYAHGFALLCFVVVIHWLIFPYSSGLLHWHCGNLTIAPVPAKQPWWICINTSCEFIMNDCITTTKQSTTKPCAYFLG